MRTRKGRAGSLWIPGSFALRQRRARALVFGYPPSGGVAAPAATVPGFFVSPTGLATNAGTFASPWSLAYALSGAGGAITPGSTVWLRGGTYGSINPTGQVSVTVGGAAGSFVAFRQYPGEHALIQDRLLLLAPWLRLWGFAITNPNLDTFNLTGVVCHAADLELVNLVLSYFSSSAISSNDISSPRTNIRGCIAYNCGFYATDLAPGHGFYIHNEFPGAANRKNISGNVVFNGFGYGLHYYAQGTTVRGVRDTDNLVMQNTFGGFLLRVGTAPSDDIVFLRPYSYNNGINLGDVTDINSYTDCSLTQATLHGGKMVLGAWKQFTWTDNTLRKASKFEVDTFYATWAAAQAGGVVMDRNDYFMDATVCAPAVCMFGDGMQALVFHNYDNLAQWRVATGQETASVAQQTSSGEPTSGNIIRVVPNADEAGLAYVHIWNWDLASQVAVDPNVRGSVLANGDTYAIYNIQADPTAAGTPAATGTFVGAPINFPMAAVSPPPRLVGSTWNGSPGSPPQLAATGPKFNTFILKKA